MPYDRDTVVRCMERHYNLLVEMAYFEESVLLRPPPTGWTDEQLMTEILAPAGRSDKVVDLLKHLPYLRRDIRGGTRNCWDIHEECRSVSYLSDSDDGPWGRECLPEYHETHFHETLMPFDGLVTPPSFIVLASARRVDGWVLDVDEGVIYDVTSWLVDEDAPEEEPWKQYGRKLGIQEFFDEVYGHIKTFLLVPVPPVDSFAQMLSGESPQGMRTKRLLEQHGWPGKLDKAAYLVALKADILAAKEERSLELANCISDSDDSSD